MDGGSTPANSSAYTGSALPKLLQRGSLVRANRLLDLVQRGHRRLDSVLYVGGRYRACLFEHMAPPRFPQAPPRYE